MVKAMVFSRTSLSSNSDIPFLHRVPSADLISVPMVRFFIYKMSMAVVSS